MTRPPNPKYSVGKPLQPIQGFSCDGVGYTMTDRGHVRCHGKKGVVQKVEFMRPEDLANMIWDYLNRDKDDEN